MLINLKNTIPKNLENTSNFEGWWLTLVAYKRSNCLSARVNVVNFLKELNFFKKVYYVNVTLFDVVLFDIALFQSCTK